MDIVKRVFFSKTLLFLILAACSTSPEEVALQTQIVATATVASWTDTPTITPTLTPTPTATLIPTPTLTPSPTPTLGVGSTKMNPQDGMVLVYVQEGEFTMGGKYEQVEEVCIGRDKCKYYYDLHEQPIHKIFLDEYWIYQTEVTNERIEKWIIKQKQRKSTTDYKH